MTSSSRPPMHNAPPPASAGAPASARSTVTHWESPATLDMPSASTASAPPAPEAPQLRPSPPHFQRTL
eukprot:2854480-Pleurochrysis_carterae.AAC.1